MIWGYQNILAQKSHTQKIDKNPQRINTLSSGVIETFWAQKIIQEKFSRFTKVLNYIKSSCIIFCTKMFGYSHCIYRLQEESIHFSLRVLRNFGLEASKHSCHKNYRRKIDKNLQRYVSYTKFPYVQNVSIPPKHILLTRTKSIFTTFANFFQLFPPPCPHF